MQARVAEYRLQAQQAMLRAAGKAWEADMLAFDAAWKKKIDAAVSRRCRRVAT